MTRIKIEEADRMISIDEAARVLGVSSKTVRRYIAGGQLAAFRIDAGGERIRLRRGDVDAILVPVSEWGIE